MTTDLTLNGVALSAAVPTALVLRVERELVGRRRYSDVEVPGRAGSWRFDEEPGNRALRVWIDIQAESFEARRDAVRELAYWADVGTTAALIVSDEPDRYHEAILADGADVEEWLVRAEIPLRFVVGPYSLASTVSTESLTANTNPDSGTFAIPDTVTAEPVVEITPAGGAMTSFVLIVNGYTLTWEGDVASGETLTISSISDTVTLGPNDDVNLTGAFDTADLDMADVAGEFPLLLEGTQQWSISWTGAATSLGIVFTWRERSR